MIAPVMPKSATLSYDALKDFLASVFLRPFLDTEYGNDFVSLDSTAIGHSYACWLVGESDTLRIKEMRPAKGSASYTNVREQYADPNVLGICSIVLGSPSFAIHKNQSNPIPPDFLELVVGGTEYYEVASNSFLHESENARDAAKILSRSPAYDSEICRAVMGLPFSGETPTQEAVAEHFTRVAAQFQSHLLAIYDTNGDELPLKIYNDR